MNGLSGDGGSGNRWLKVTIKAEPRLVEPIADFLVGVIGAGVETGARDEPSYGTVNGYIEQANLSREETDELLAKIGGYLAEMADIFRVPVPTLTADEIEEEDWGRSWKAHFRPFTIIPGLVIAPSWEAYRPAAGEQVITMDPGLAFGTGHHATTSLCLELIHRTLAGTAGRRLLDVGTGTGILGMAALLFGAEAVLALDNDPEAVAAAETNVAGNGLAERMQVALTPLSAVTGSYQVVVANIVHDVLLALADDLARVTAEGGSLVLSGLLAGSQVDSIAATFTARGLRPVDRLSRGEWAALRLVKD